MEHKIITIFYIIDEYLKIIGKKDDVRSKISNSEIMLIGYLAVSSLNGNYYRAYEFSQMMKLVKKNRLFKIYTKNKGFRESDGKNIFSNRRDI